MRFFLEGKMRKRSIFNHERIVLLLDIIQGAQVVFFCTEIFKNMTETGFFEYFRFVLSVDSCDFKVIGSENIYGTYFQHLIFALYELLSLLGADAIGAAVYQIIGAL